MKLKYVLKYLAVALLWCAPALAQPQTFQQRCTAAGVVRCVDFSGPSVISGRYGDPTGILQALAPDDEPIPTIDTVIKPGDGAVGSLHWSLRVGDGGTTSYFANFSDYPFVTQFGVGDEFYVQWRQRVDTGWIIGDNIPTDIAGEKHVIIGVGDTSACTPSTSAFCATSCTELEVVPQNTYLYGLPQMYHSCGAKNGSYEPLKEPIPPAFTDFYLQNMPRIGPGAPGCLYNGGNPVLANCFAYVANEWATFQVHVKIGSWYDNRCQSGCPPGVTYNHDSIVQLWVRHEGGPTKLALDFNPTSDPSCHTANPDSSVPACQTGYDLVNLNPSAQKYGKVWLIPRVGNSPAHYTQPANTWYAELIVSRIKIADPSQ